MWNCFSASFNTSAFECFCSAAFFVHWLAFLFYSSTSLQSHLKFCVSDKITAQDFLTTTGSNRHIRKVENNRFMLSSFFICKEKYSTSFPKGLNTRCSDEWGKIKLKKRRELATFLIKHVANLLIRINTRATVMFAKNKKKNRLIWLNFIFISSIGQKAVGVHAEYMMNELKQPLTV